MRDSFVFYSSFAQAASMLGDKARLKLYDAVVNLGLCCAENVTELEQTCSEIESKLVQNRNAFAQFLLIKPQIIANFTKYINGSKGAKYGALGGAPIGNKNAVKNNPKTTPNVNENENVNENDNKKEIKKKDSADAPNKQYAFEGKIIKLKQKDFDAWKLAYPDLNLRGELLQRDIWLQEQPEAEQKKWFISTSQFFIKQNERRKAQNTCITGQYNANEKPETENECWF